MADVSIDDCDIFCGCPSLLADDAGFTEAVGRPGLLFVFDGTGTMLIWGSSIEDVASEGCGEV